MNFARQRELAYSVYPEGLPYSFDECMEILGCFFNAYEYYRGEEHPMLRREQLRQVMENLPSVEVKGSGLCPDIPFEGYPDLIEAYFHKRYKACDYRINHFLRGRVREILMYENGFY